MEGSLVLSVTALMRAGALVPGERTGGLWGWTYEGEDRPHAIVSYEANLTVPDDPWLRLRYRVNGERVDCMVRLVTHAAELRRAPVVVPLPARAAPGGEALPAAGRQAVREPRGLRADLCVLPSEREPADRVHRRGCGRERPAGSQGDAHTGLPRRETADRWARHVRAGRTGVGTLSTAPKPTGRPTCARSGSGRERS